MLRLYAAAPQHAAALIPANRRHGLDELRLIGHAIDADGFTAGMINHHDDGVRFDAVLLS
jgi:hypothetical protein